MSYDPITLQEYAEVGPEYFAKFNYVKTNLPADSSVEDCLKIMESIAAQVMIKREEEESEVTIGFNK